MTTATFTRTTEVFDFCDEYALSEEFTLTVNASNDAKVTEIKELILNLADRKALGYSANNGWPSLLLDMACLKASGRSNWQQPIAHLLPVLKRFGSEQQVEQALIEFAADNTPAFTTIEDFEFGRVGGLYFEPEMWWGYLKQFSTPEVMQGFWDRMQDFYDEWSPSEDEWRAEFAEVDSAGVMRKQDERKAAAEQKELKRQQELDACTPSKTGLSREEYLAAYLAALEGGADVTGLASAIKALHMPETSERRMKIYMQQRIESPTSPVAQKLLAATESADVMSLVQSLYQSGRYNNTKLPEEVEAEASTEEEEVKEEPQTPTELYELCWGESDYEPLFRDAERCKEVILANIETIAEEFCEGNTYEQQDYEPQWLMEALIQAGAEAG